MQGQDFVGQGFPVGLPDSSTRAVKVQIPRHPDSSQDEPLFLNMTFTIKKANVDIKTEVEGQIGHIEEFNTIAAILKENI